jgi:serine/threonine protein kinase
MTELKLQQCRLDNRYDIQECLGRGSYAEIYIARDISVDDKHPHSLVVIKALNLLLQGASDVELEQTLVENFQNEAVALDRVRHPNIISRLGHGTAIDLSGTTFHYLVLEYLSGGDLAAHCRKQPLSLGATLFCLEQVCAGLAYAHECNVIHRDIKPQNLLLAEGGKTVKIADFGVAKIEAMEGAITRVGTNIYAAPEHNPLLHTGQLDSTSLAIVHMHLTPAADIYSLAKTTYALLAGDSPRRFSHRPVTELPASVTHHDWAPPILRVLQRATQNNPAERYQTVGEFWDELSDAALPPTRLLKQPDTTENLSRPGDQLTAAIELTSQAPPRPRFDSTRNLRRLKTNGNARPRIVVQVRDAESAPLPARRATQQAAHEILAGLPDVSPQDARKTNPQRDSGAGRGARFLVALALIIAFAGMLLATHNYFRGRLPLWGTEQQNASPSGTDIGREVYTTTDVYLRPDAGTSNAPIGKAEMGSRVRVLSVNANWYEVQIIQHGRRPDAGGLTGERGWINKRYLNLDS